jgi:2,4-dichlorophenol 6-monooxygenase
MPGSKQLYRDFSFCYSILERQYARFDHFQHKANASFLNNDSPTNVTHLPQSSFESILREEVEKSSACSRYIGWECVSISSSSDDSTLRIRNIQGGSESTVKARYLIGADGASSVIRKSIGVKMSGEAGLQTLLNVFFRCKGFSKLLPHRPSMLYFVFNEVSSAPIVICYN